MVCDFDIVIRNCNKVMITVFMIVDCKNDWQLFVFIMILSKLWHFTCPLYLHLAISSFYALCSPNHSCSTIIFILCAYLGYTLLLLAGFVKFFCIPKLYKLDSPNTCGLYMINVFHATRCPVHECLIVITNKSLMKPE